MASPVVTLIIMDRNSIPHNATLTTRIDTQAKYGTGKLASNLVPFTCSQTSSTVSKLRSCCAQKWRHHDIHTYIDTFSAAIIGPRLRHKGMRIFSEHNSRVHKHLGCHPCEAGCGQAEQSHNPKPAHNQMKPPHADTYMVPFKKAAFQYVSC